MSLVIAATSADAIYFAADTALTATVVPPVSLLLPDGRKVLPVGPVLLGVTGAVSGAQYAQLALEAGGPWPLESVTAFRVALRERLRRGVPPAAGPIEVLAGVFLDGLPHLVTIETTGEDVLHEARSYGDVATIGGVNRIPADTLLAGWRFVPRTAAMSAALVVRVLEDTAHLVLGLRGVQLWRLAADGTVSRRQDVDVLEIQRAVTRWRVADLATFKTVGEVTT